MYLKKHLTQQVQQGGSVLILIYRWMENRKTMYLLVNVTKRI